MRELVSDIRAFISAPAPEPGRFDALALRLFSFQYNHNAPYRSFCNARGITPQNLRHLSQIPAVPTAAFKELDLTVLDYAERSCVFYSSGTTDQKRSRHFHSHETLRLYEDSLLRWFEPHLCPDAVAYDFLILTPTASAAPNSSLVHMFQTVSTRFGASTQFTASNKPDGSWVLDQEKISTSVEKFSHRPVIICGTAFSFVHLCDHLADQNKTLHFPEGSRVLETGGYKGRSRTVSKVELHAMISDRLSIPGSNIVTEYGMSELSSQAYDCIAGQTFRGSAPVSGASFGVLPNPNLFHFPHWARATIISPETGAEVGDGESGLLRVLDLANAGSVCAVQTEDLAIRRGHAFDLIGRAELAEARGCSLMQVNQ